MERISTRVAAPKEAQPVVEAAETNVTEDETTLVVPIKKRRYVEPDSEDEPLAAVKETSRTIKRQHQNEPGQNKKRREGKEQALQTDTKAPLKNMVSARKQATWLPLPGIDYPSPEDQVLNQDFWLRTLKKHLNQSKFSDVLKVTEFTEEQHEILQQTFMQLSRKLSQTAKYNEHFVKIHRCLYCDFTVSHQCTPISDVMNVPSGLELLGPSFLMPDRLILCMCGFAFLHKHLKRSRAYSGLREPSKLSPYLRELDRSINVSCPKCYINMIMSKRGGDVCDDLANWDNTKDGERQRFYNSIVHHLHYEPPNTLSLDGFYGCSKGCCRLFHRCCPDEK